MTFEKMTHEQQTKALSYLVADWATKKDRNVKGAYTSGDFVTWTLARIFGPGGWSFTILDGPELVKLSDQSAYVRVVGRLAVTFANGQTAHQDDIGIWPLKATRGGDLSQTAAERYETVEKAARTDCLKNAARNLGTCFAPLSDLELEAHIKREAYRQANAGQKPPSAGVAATELYDTGPVTQGGEATSEQALDANDGDDEAFVCQTCGQPLTDFQVNGRTFTVSQLIDIGQGLQDGGIICGPCLKARKEAAKGRKGKQ